MPTGPGASARSIATIVMWPSWRERRTAITTSSAIRTTPTSGAGRAGRAPCTTGSRTLARSSDKNMAGNGTITRLGPHRFRLVTGAGYVNSDLGWLRLEQREEDGPVDLRETTEDLCVVGIWGPNARAVLEGVTDDDVSEGGFPFMQARDIRIAGFAVFAQRVTYVGELGWEFYLDPRVAVQVWDRLMAAGETFGIRPGGYRALDSLR